MQVLALPHNTLDLVRMITAKRPDVYEQCDVAVHISLLVPIEKQTLPTLFCTD